MMPSTESPPPLRDLVDPSMLRELPGWKDAPVPACLGGDPRSLTFCCAPGYGLTFGFKCRREEVLDLLGLTMDEFTRIKDEFSREHGWDDDGTCFKSLSYCCMRAGGCPGNRDSILRKKYPGKDKTGIMKEYFALKRLLAIRLLEGCKNVALVRPFLAHERARHE